MESSIEYIKSIQAQITNKKLELEAKLNQSDASDLFKSWKELNETLTDLEETKSDFETDPTYEIDLDMEVDLLATSKLLVALLKERICKQNDPMLLDYLENELQIEVDKIIDNEGAVIKRLNFFRINIRNKEAELKNDSIRIKQLEEILHENDSKKASRLWRKFDKDIRGLALDSLNNELKQILDLVGGENIDERLNKLDNILILMKDFNKAIFERFESQSEAISNEFLSLKRLIKKSILANKTKYNTL